MKSPESKDRRTKKEKRKKEIEGTFIWRRKATGALAIMERRPLFGRPLRAKKPLSLSLFLFLFRNETKSSSNIYGELRVERANSRSDVDTYVRFHLRRRWSAMSSSSDSLIVCSSARINQKDAEPGAAGTRMAAPLSLAIVATASIYKRLLGATRKGPTITVSPSK